MRLPAIKDALRRVGGVAMGGGDMTGQWETIGRCYWLRSISKHTLDLVSLLPLDLPLEALLPHIQESTES